MPSVREPDDAFIWMRSNESLTATKNGVFFVFFYGISPLKSYIEVLNRSRPVLWYSYMFYIVLQHITLGIIPKVYIKDDDIRKKTNASITLD